MSNRAHSIQFRAQIYCVGINRCVDLPRQFGVQQLPTGSVARQGFQSLTEANRRRLLQWISDVKSPEARRRRIEVAKRRLEERTRNRNNGTPKNRTLTRKKQDEPGHE